MMPTGIVERVDELGRIYIPKEVRAYAGLSKNSPLEFFLDANGCIIMKPYDTADSLIDRIRALEVSFGIIKNDLDSDTAFAVLKHITALKQIVGDWSNNLGGKAD